MMDNKPFIDFDGKKVIVTGASSGLGREIVIELGKRGAFVILVGRNMERLEETASHLASQTYRILSMDLSRHLEIVPTIKSLAKECGRIYGLCNTAGIVDTRPLSACSAEHLKDILDVNLISGIELARAVSRRDIIQKSGGAILFISSIYSSVGVPGQIGYSASKGAVTSAARAMAIELARKNIRVNVISPGLVRTKMADEALSVLSEKQIEKIVDKHPLGIGSPEDVARTAVFLLAPQNTWFTGSDIVIDGGYTAV